MKQLLSLLLVLISFPLLAQVIENPGFEDWEEIDNGNLEPVNWSSLQTAEPENIGMLSPQVIFKDSIDPHTGNYCLRMKNAYVAIADVVANGLVTNGRIHADFNPDSGSSYTNTADAQWHTTNTTRPDSIVGYYKYSPDSIDVTNVKALLHSGNVGIIPDPDSTGWIGMANFISPNEEISEWTRFSAPFIYFSDEDPEYVLFNVSGGNGVNAIAGSIVWYDDLEFVYNPVGLDEKVANELLRVYSDNRDIVIDLRRFGAGEAFQVEIFNLGGQLILSDNMISGSTSSWKMEESGIYLCKLQSKDGLSMAKKVFVK